MLRDVLLLNTYKYGFLFVSYFFGGAYRRHRIHVRDARIEMMDERLEKYRFGARFVAFFLYNFG